MELEGLKVKSTSYGVFDFEAIFIALAKFYNPKVAVEVGTQQGGSAIALGRGMESGSKLFVYDKFDDSYDYPPHGPTWASMNVTKRNLDEAKLNCDVEVRKGDVFEVHENHKSIDVLHLDTGNQYDLLTDLLPLWLPKVTSAVILEGGIENRWQRDHGYKPYRPILDEPLVADEWDHVTFCRDDHYAMTLLTRIPSL